MPTPIEEVSPVMRILIASSIYHDAVDELRKDHDVLCAFNAKEDVLKSVIRDREALIFRSGVQITADVMKCARDLKLLLRAGSGVDNVDLNYVREKGLELVRIPGPGAKAVAEMSFGMMLALSRNLREADRLTREGHWAKHDMTGYLLTGKTLGIVGAGNIGTLTGQRGVAWGMEVIGCVAHPTHAREDELRKKGIRLTTFEDVLAHSDYVSLHVPLNDTTRGLMNASAIGRMKPGAYLINLSRGGVVDEQALYEALVSGHLRGAGVDVHVKEGMGMVSPLAALPNVVLTPHIGAETHDSQREIGDIVIEQIGAYVAKQRGLASANGKAEAPVVREQQ